ncbi:class I SAM-dependent methyltransferase [bacterium]|nr:class I SAM-dependent methyltransferase [bacterium]
MSTQKSFIDFYNKNHLIPVKQNLKSKVEHLSKRDFLYSSVGLSSLTLKNASILEFGPGTGQNAINWLNYNPSSITLVDGADAAIEEITKNFSEVEVPKNIDLSLIKSEFTEFKSKKKYDIIWAEGCIPHQSDIDNIINSMLNHLSIDGIFTCSTISGLAHLSETIRRVSASIVLNKLHPEIDDLDFLVNIYKNDLRALSNSTRFVEDWVLDVIIQPLHTTSLCSIPDVLEISKNTHIPYHTYPKLSDSVCWYKDFNPHKYVEEVIEQYYRNCMHFISNNAPSGSNLISDGIEAEQLGNKSWEYASQYQTGEIDLKSFVEVLKDLGKLYKSYEYSVYMPELFDVAKWLENGCPVKSGKSILTDFWGKCTQFVSLKRPISF